MSFFLFFVEKIHCAFAQFIFLLYFCAEKPNVNGHNSILAHANLEKVDKTPQ